MRPSSNTVGQQVSGIVSSSQLNSQPRIKTVNIGMRYGDLQVFKDVNLAVGESEVLALVGPSGCGKTTLLRCLDGLIPVSEGEILVDGQPVNGPPPSVAVVFQHFGL